MLRHKKGKQCNSKESDHINTIRPDYSDKIISTIIYLTCVAFNFDTDELKMSRKD